MYRSPAAAAVATAVADEAACGGDDDYDDNFPDCQHRHLICLSSLMRKSYLVESDEPVQTLSTLHARDKVKMETNRLSPVFIS